jgi:hypothetical protein
MAATVSSGELRNSAGAAVAKPKGGIPWNDSPKMRRRCRSQLPPNPLAGGRRRRTLRIRRVLAAHPLNDASPSAGRAVCAQRGPGAS